MNWISVEDMVPLTVEQATGTGQRYFSSDVFVKRGKTKWTASYKPLTDQWFTKKGTEITKYVKYWKPKPTIN